MEKLTPYLGEVLDENSFSQLVERSFPQISIERTHLITSGWESKVLIVNDEYVFRFPRWLELVPKLRREVKLLPLLKERLNVRVPENDFISDGVEFPESEDAAFVGYRMLPGELLTAEIFQEHVREQSAAFERCAAQFGGFLTALHKFPQDKAIALGYQVARPDSFKPFLTDLKMKTESALTPAAFKRVGEFVTRALKLWDGCRFQPVMTHGDLAPEHVLFAPDAGEISGVIDFGDAAIDDPASDFVTIYCQYGARFAEAVLAHYEPGLDDLAFARCEVYRRLEPFYWIDYGLGSNKPGHVKAGVTMLEMDTHDLAGFQTAR